jgi:hypothetical protein
MVCGAFHGGLAGVCAVGGQRFSRRHVVGRAGGGAGAAGQGQTPAATTARLSELQARIRPHFLFNTLNSAIALVRAEPPRPKHCWKT